MDATENDLPPSVPFQIQGFPTLKFKKAGTREFVDYDGDRTLESLVTFVEENAVNSLKAPEKNTSESVPPPPVDQEVLTEEHHEHHDEL